ncbi:MAG TPA: T9SS type A sorting domain-containing protein [bacterium]|jgi:hypothetical protein
MRSSIASFEKKIVLILSVLLLVSAAMAQPDPCNIPPGDYLTVTQGGWGAPCHGNNPGCIRDNNFATVFPSGLTIGGNFTATFLSDTSIENFLPAGGPPSMLTANLTNPTSTPAGVFAGQVLTLAITLGFSNAGVTGFNSNLGNLVVPVGVHTPSGPFAGYTVNQIFALANQVLGGDLGALPAGITVSDLNDVVDAINNNFDGGSSGGFLVEPDCDQILPVELTSFTAVGAFNRVDVSWVTASERNVAGYDLARETANGWSTIAHLAGLGDNPAGHTYTYHDAQVLAGTTYRYRLSMTEADGSRHPLGSVIFASPLSASQPTTYALNQNYPNPFNPSTSIVFDLVDNGFVSLKVYNLLGEEVASLVNSNMAGGNHVVRFDASHLSSGLYLYRLNVNGFVAEKKMLLMK